MQYIQVLYDLVETCARRDEMLRDSLVVGIRDVELSDYRLMQNRRPTEGTSEGATLNSPNNHLVEDATRKTTGSQRRGKKGPTAKYPISE